MNAAQNKGGRPRSTTNEKLPKGVRMVEGKLYWRGTDPASREVEKALREAGVSRRCGTTVAEAKSWYSQNVEPRLKGQS